ncbi:MAG: UPF0104 family protein [Afipia sp.]|nr:UPF0104 family protein [Afipia sp.]
MLEKLRGMIAFAREKNILHKIGVALSVTIIAVAAYVLYGMLKSLNFSEVLHAMRATKTQAIVLAGLCVAAGYFTLTFYDLFALRTIGKNDVPYRIAAFAAFTSYSIGHNVGASVLTGGAVRYRIYSAYALNAIDVAKICFLAGLTFWLGNAAVLGLGVAYHPDAASSIDHLPQWLNRLFAFGILAALTAYVAWVWNRPRVVGRGTWTVTLPGGPLTLLQIVIGIVDLTFCSLAMYILMPQHPHVDFVVIAVIFVSATLLGFASHSPGGLGVFDAAMLYGCLHFQSRFAREELLASLLLFRVLYYITPFVISLALLSMRELMIGFKARRVKAAMKHLDDVAQAKPPQKT